MTPRAADRGAATVWAATAAALLLAVTALLLDVGSAVVARHRAQAAADLAALAAAGDPVEGERVACAAAERVVGGMDGRLAACALDGWNALVEVRVERSWSLLTRSTATARAHAGPGPRPPPRTAG